MKKLFKILSILLSINLFNPAYALDFPTKSIRIVTGVSPGSGVDVVARFIAQQLSERLRINVIVENKPGGGQTIAANEVASAKSNGHVLLFATQTFATNPSVFKKLPYDTKLDFTPLAFVGEMPYVIFVNSQVPADTLGDFIKLVRDNPGKYNYASAGPSSLPKLAAEHLKQITQTDILHIPFKSASPAVLSLGSGETHLWIANILTVRHLLESQRVRAIAVATRSRLPQYPNLPTVKESGYENYFYSSWYAILAPGGIPDAHRQFLNNQINLIVASLPLRQLLEKSGATVGPLMTTQELSNFIDDEIKKYRTIIQNLKVE
jgi:tripartite-type tricarboxylate transporter receptor subunit TctC